MVTQVDTQAYDAVAARLGISQPDKLFRDCPPGVKPDEILKALQGANEALSGGEAPSTLQQRQDILAKAGQMLLADKSLYESAVHLTRVCDETIADAAFMAHIRIIGLYRAGKTEEVIRESERLLGSAPQGSRISEVIRNSLRQWNLERSISRKAEYLPSYFGDLEAALQDPFRASYPDGPYRLVERIIPFVSALHGRDQFDESFVRRIRWGAQAHRQMVFLRSLSGDLAGKKGLSCSEDLALQLLDAHSNKIEVIDPADLIGHVDAGQSVVIADLHSGMTVVQSYGLPFGSIPMSVVSAFPGKAVRPQDFHLGVSGNTVARDLAKLVKLMRKDPRVVRIFPDGGAGEKSTLDVLGRKVQIGKGGASIAWTGRAVVYSGRSVWNGERFTMEMHRGPSSADFSNFEDFEAAFNSFYAARIEAVLRGAPEDMAPDGGFWRFFC